MCVFVCVYLYYTKFVCVQNVAKKGVFDRFTRIRCWIQPFRYFLHNAGTSLLAEIAPPRELCARFPFCAHQSLLVCFFLTRIFTIALVFHAQTYTAWAWLCRIECVLDIEMNAAMISFVHFSSISDSEHSSMFEIELSHSFLAALMWFIHHLIC